MNQNANSQNTETTESTESKSSKQARPTRKQFGFARKLAADNGIEIPAAAVYNRKAMGAFIAAHTPAAA